jgi:hypothetical protein
MTILWLEKWSSTFLAWVFTSVLFYSVPFSLESTSFLSQLRNGDTTDQNQDMCIRAEFRTGLESDCIQSMNTMVHLDIWLGCSKLSWLCKFSTCSRLGRSTTNSIFLPAYSKISYSWYRSDDRWLLSGYYTARKRRHGGSSRWTLRCAMGRVDWISLNNLHCGRIAKTRAWRVLP